MLLGQGWESVFFVASFVVDSQFVEGERLAPKK